MRWIYADALADRAVRANTSAIEVVATAEPRRKLPILE
jgi:hypothetical protein